MYMYIWERGGGGRASWAPRSVASVAVVRSTQVRSIGRRGVVLKQRGSLQKSPCPVVICPYLCSSDADVATSAT